jgi:hypothetical protein
MPLRSVGSAGFLSYYPMRPPKLTRATLTFDKDLLEKRYLYLNKNFSPY